MQLNLRQLSQANLWNQRDTKVFAKYRTVQLPPNSPLQLKSVGWHPVYGPRRQAQGRFLFDIRYRGVEYVQGPRSEANKDDGPLRVNHLDYVYEEDAFWFLNNNYCPEVHQALIDHAHFYHNHRYATSILKAIRDTASTRVSHDNLSVNRGSIFESEGNIYEITRYAQNDELLCIFPQYRNDIKVVYARSIDINSSKKKRTLVFGDIEDITRFSINDLKRCHVFDLVAPRTRRSLGEFLMVISDHLHIRENFRLTFRRVSNQWGRHMNRQRGNIYVRSFVVTQPAIDHIKANGVMEPNDLMNTRHYPFKVRLEPRSEIRHIFRGNWFEKVMQRQPGGVMYMDRMDVLISRGNNIKIIGRLLLLQGGRVYGEQEEQKVDISMDDTSPLANWECLD